MKIVVSWQNLMKLQAPIIFIGFALSKRKSESEYFILLKMRERIWERAERFFFPSAPEAWEREQMREVYGNFSSSASFAFFAAKGPRESVPERVFFSSLFCPLLSREKWGFRRLPNEFSLESFLCNFLLIGSVESLS